MKIQYASDLHLEFAENRNYLENGGLAATGDVLVLAGDVSYLGHKEMMRLPFFDWCAEHFRETFIVPGNHEFYGGYDIAETIVDYQFAYRDNVRYVNNRSVVLEDTEVFFTTLWTRINSLHLQEIQLGLNDFRYGIMDGRRFCADDVDGLHQRCLEWLDAALKASRAMHKVVVSHHCPTLREAFNGYPGSVLNTAFQVDLDAFIERSGVDYWIYGHTHFSGGSGSKIGDTTLLCNQLGYVRNGEHKAFESSLTVPITLGSRG